MENDDKPLLTGPYIWPGHTEPTPRRLMPSECNAMLDAWRAEFPEMRAIVDKWKRRFAEKGSALDCASRLWGCAWLVKGRKRERETVC